MTSPGVGGQSLLEVLVLFLTPILRFTLVPGPASSSLCKQRSVVAPFLVGSRGKSAFHARGRPKGHRLHGRHGKQRQGGACHGSAQWAKAGGDSSRTFRAGARSFGSLPDKRARIGPGRPQVMFLSQVDPSASHLLPRGHKREKTHKCVVTGSSNEQREASSVLPRWQKWGGGNFQDFTSGPSSSLSDNPTPTPRVCRRRLRPPPARPPPARPEAHGGHPQVLVLGEAASVVAAPPPLLRPASEGGASMVSS